MREFLLIDVHGPMSAWGEVAPGEERPTAAWPTRSALLGMVAAALGVDRHDRQGHAALDGLSMGLRVERDGALLLDFHTTQVLGQQRDLRTRADELYWESADRLQTILSTRGYLCDAWFTVGLWWERDGTPAHTLEALAEALRRPRWTLYLGRKSCPLAAPLHPQVIRAQSFCEALAQRTYPQDDPLRDSRAAGGRTRQRVVWQGEHGGFEAQDRVTRRDVAQDRERWQFTEREERRGWWRVEAHELREADDERLDAEE